MAGEPDVLAEARTGQGRWLLAHQGLINIGRLDGSMRGDEIDLRQSILTIEAEAAPSPEPLPREALRGDGPCADCGTLNNIVWFTDNVFWNAVTGESVVHEETRGAILCVHCFVTRADDAGFRPVGWRLLPDWARRSSTACTAYPIPIPVIGAASRATIAASSCGLMAASAGPGRGRRPTACHSRLGIRNRAWFGMKGEWAV